MTSINKAHLIATGTQPTVWQAQTFTEMADEQWQEWALAAVTRQRNCRWTADCRWAAEVSLDDWSVAGQAKCRWTVQGSRVGIQPL